MIDSWILRNVLNEFLEKRVAHTKLEILTNFKIFDSNGRVTNFGSLVYYLGNTYTIQKDETNCFSVKQIAC